MSERRRRQHLRRKVIPAMPDGTMFMQSGFIEGHRIGADQPKGPWMDVEDYERLFKQLAQGNYVDHRARFDQSSRSSGFRRILVGVFRSFQKILDPDDIYSENWMAQVLQDSRQWRWVNYQARQSRARSSRGRSPGDSRQLFGSDSVYNVNQDPSVVRIDGAGIQGRLRVVRGSPGHNELTVQRNNGQDAGIKVSLRRDGIVELCADSTSTDEQTVTAQHEITITLPNRTRHVDASNVSGGSIENVSSINATGCQMDVHGQTVTNACNSDITVSSSGVVASANNSTIRDAGGITHYGQSGEVIARSSPDISSAQSLRQQLPNGGDSPDELQL